jgi:hypothetical protein
MLCSRHATAACVACCLLHLQLARGSSDSLRLMSHHSLDAALTAAPRIHPARRVVTLKPYKASDGTQLAQDPDTGDRV